MKSSYAVCDQVNAWLIFMNAMILNNIAISFKGRRMWLKIEQLKMPYKEDSVASQINVGQNWKKDSDARDILQCFYMLKFDMDRGFFCWKLLEYDIYSRYISLRIFLVMETVLSWNKMHMACLVRFLYFF